MNIDWMLVLILVLMSLPGIVIAIKRLIFCLIPNNTLELKNRISRFAMSQIVIMVLIMSIAGSALSPLTGFQVVYIEHFFDGQANVNSILSILLPTFSYTLLGLVIFCSLYYGVLSALLDEASVHAMNKIRKTIGVSGCMLYGGVVEEILVRWGIMSVVAFFANNMVGHKSNLTIIISILLSGLMFAISQIPLYIAAGCVSSRRLIYSIVTLSLCQSFLFGFLFWQFGLLSAILAHMLFHLGWSRYDKVY